MEEVPSLSKSGDEVIAPSVDFQTPPPLDPKEIGVRSPGIPPAVSHPPPRKGPISRYFIPLKGFSSGLVESEPESPEFGSAASAVAGFVSFAFRSVRVCAKPVRANNHVSAQK